MQGVKVSLTYHQLVLPDLWPQNHGLSPAIHVNQRKILCWTGTQNKPQTTTDGADWNYLDQQLHQWLQSNWN